MSSSEPEADRSFSNHSLRATRTVDARVSTVPGGFLWSFLLFGAVPALAFVVYGLARAEYFTVGYAASIGFLVVFLLVAPYVVWYYDGVLLPSFFVAVSELVESEGRLAEISRSYQRWFSNRWWVPCILTFPTVAVLLFGGRSFVRSHGLFGLGDPLFWVVFLALLWIATFVAIGIAMLYTTLGIVRAIAAEELIIDPLHRDGLGGVSTVGYLAIRTTVMLSLGSLLLPLQFQYAISTGSLVTAVIYFNGVLYAVGIAVSFVYPTVLINRRANELRDETLEELRDQYRTLKQQSQEPRYGASLESTDQELELKLQRVRNEYRDFQQVTLYPLELSILARLVASVLLPLVFIVVDTLLRPGVLEEILSWLS